MIIYAYKDKERSICFSTLILNILLSLVLPKLEKEIPRDSTGFKAKPRCIRYILSGKD